MRDLVLESRLHKGDRGRQVTLIQEWLGLHMLRVAIDGDFGPATEAAVRRFQARAGLEASGVVDADTFAALTAPMTRALRPIPANGQDLGSLVVAYAEQHLVEQPREIGGDNRGPWVRLYMKGNHGPEWRWCAGFACFLLEQACATLCVPLPVESSFSCDRLAQSARTRRTFLTESEARSRRPSPGSFFLIRRTDIDWIHTGVVVRTDSDVVETIEGNTNDDGSRNGHEVCRRIRRGRNIDFIAISA